MRSSFMGFEVQKRSIQLAQKNLDITGHNLGNIGTVGFTRQRIDTASLSISSFTYWQTKMSRLSLAGQGVTAFGVSQIRNDYLDKRYRDMTPFAKEYDIKLSVAMELETTLDNIDNFGLLAAFDDLKSALERVSLSQPDAKEMTSQVRNQVSNICAMLRTYHSELNRILENNILELSNSVTATNNLIDSVVAYNKAITAEYISDAGRIMRGQGVSEYGPLELLDARNLLLDELAQYGNIEVFQNNNGSVRVTMAGVTIIDDQFSEKIVLQNYHDYGAAVLNFSNGIAFQPIAGELKAYMDVVNGYGPYSTGLYQNSEYGIPYYLQALDAFAAGFAELMNGVNQGELTDSDVWSRSLLWAGYEFNADGTPRTTELRDANGDIIYERNADGSFVLDFDGNRVPVMTQVRARVSAANIRISDEWMKDSLLIAHTFDAAAHNDAFTRAAYMRGQNGTYNVWDDFFENGAWHGLVPAGTNVTDVNSLILAWGDNAALRSALNQFMQRDGSTARANFPSGITFPSRAALEQEGWRGADLNGTNLLRFVRALESSMSWGSAMDFHGSAFGYLMFLSDRLATGISFMEEQFDMTMDTVNTLLDNRDAISGVSETEEGINMLTYQKWFNASARLMTTLDEALDTLINRMGRVGL
ncbi:MAG: hypothetical protein FWG83_03915 [Oscillospiraceae bacterium]|nr:hypothetical protein [Oscillospiraceae bacterium]